MVSFFDQHSVCITEPRLDYPGPRILYVNKKFEELTGYTSEEVLGRSPRILQGPKTDRRVLDRLRECCAKGEYFEGSAVNYRKDKVSFNMVWNINPIKINGKLAAFLSLQQGDEFAETLSILEKIKVKQEDIDRGVEQLFRHIIEKRAS